MDDFSHQSLVFLESLGHLFAQVGRVVWPVGRAAAAQLDEVRVPAGDIGQELSRAVKFVDGVLLEQGH